MNTIIVASHGGLAEGLVKSSFMIFGEQEKVIPVTFNPGEGPDDLMGKYQDILANVQEGEQVLFLVDVLGGSPYNVACQIAAKNRYAELITGVNLPLLLESYMDRTKDLKVLIPDLLEAGENGIIQFKFIEMEEDL